MRGYPLHNFIVRQIQMIAGEFFELVVLEHLSRRNGVSTYLDVFARQGSVTLAFETTSRHAIDNAKKASLVGMPLWFVVPRRCLKIELTRKLSQLDLKPGGEPIKILLLGQLQQELTDYLSLFIHANRMKDKQ